MVSFTTPDHDSAWRSSVGRFGAAPRLARIFLLLMVSFADAQQCANTAIGAPGYASDCDCAIEFASNEFATEDDYDFITVNGVSSHGYSLTNVQVAAEIAQLVDTFSTTTFGAAQACTHGSLETLKARVATKSLSNMTSTGAKVDPTLDDFQTTLMVSIISYLGGLPETDTFKAKNTIDVAEAAHETDPDSIPQARSSTTAPAPLPLIWECSVCSMAVQCRPGLCAAPWRLDPRLNPGDAAAQRAPCRQRYLSLVPTLCSARLGGPLWVRASARRRALPSHDGGLRRRADHGTAAAATFAFTAALAAITTAVIALDGCFGAVVLLRLVRRHVHHRWHWKL